MLPLRFRPSPSSKADAGPDQTVPGPSPVNVQFDGSGSTGDIVSYKWYNQWGLLRAEGVTPDIEVNFGYDNPQPGTTRTFTLVVEDSQGNTAQDQVTITLTLGEALSISVPGNQPRTTWAEVRSDIGDLAHPGLTCWSLVGRIGNSTPFQVGTGVSFLVETGGRLYLGVNDEKGRFRNNSGSWTVNIAVNAPD
jgi:hypothetical protein